MEPEETTAETQQLSPLHTVTSLSKYLAMALFIVLPFLGGWIGYTYAPGKVVEVERVVVNEVEVEKSKFNLRAFENVVMYDNSLAFSDDEIGISFWYPKEWGDLSYSVNRGWDCYADEEPCYKSEKNFSVDFKFENNTSTITMSAQGSKYIWGPKGPFYTPHTSGWFEFPSGSGQFYNDHQFEDVPIDYMRLNGAHKFELSKSNVLYYRYYNVSQKLCREDSEDFDKKFETFVNDIECNSQEHWKEELESGDIFTFNTDFGAFSIASEERNDFETILKIAETVEITDQGYIVKPTPPDFRG
jgi:hypothetical protein